MPAAEWQAAQEMEHTSASTSTAGEVLAHPTTYAGTQFRSALEASWACTLDHFGIEWQYEPWLYRAPSGEKYLPDFWLPAVRTFIEVKGTHMRRVHKPQQLARGVVTADVIVLIGFPPARTSQSPYLWEAKLQWRDPLGYDTRLARCPGCSAWQWLRAQVSRCCRVCGTAHTGLLAKASELPFQNVPAARPSWMDAF